jgi:tetratricopeptide (TPR) repeat protein
VKYWNDKTRVLVLFALTFLIYGFGIGRGFDFDDLIYISENPFLRRPYGFHTYWFTAEVFNYYPLFWSLLRVQYLLWGVHPLGYHLVNLFMHSVNAVLLWRVCREWRLPGAWWIAALFAVHPVNAQTLAWAAEQKNTWSFFFMALALLAFIRHERDRHWAQYALSLVWFAAALACKTSTVCLPVFLTIFYLFNIKTDGTILLRLIPYYALGLAAGVTTVWFEKHRVSAKSLLGTLSLWQRLETAGATFWLYLEKALIPIHLTPMYHGWVDTTAATHTALPGLLLIALLLCCAAFWRRIGAPIALGIAYYTLMLLPLLGIFDTNYFAYSLVADHWQYHALPGIIVAVVVALQRLAQRWPSLAAYPNAAGAAAVVGVAALASAHFAHFEDPRSLWSYVVEQNSDAWIGWYNLGNVFADDHQPDQAIASYRRSIRIKNDYYQSHYNLANALSARGQTEEAEREYLAAEKIKDDDADLHNNRAVALMRLGREDDAVAEFTRALELDANETSSHVNLLAILLKRGQVEDAARHLEMARPLSEANARRTAEAITTTAQHGAVPIPALQRFAQRALELSGGQPDLRAALAALKSAAPLPTSTQFPVHSPQ